MLIPPKYTLTNQISEFLSSIEASRAVIENIEIPRELEMNIRRSSNLKSSLFSARIEGNPLTLSELSYKSTKDIKKIEIVNILKAINLISSTHRKSLTAADLKNYHKIIMKDLPGSSSIGYFRSEVSAIFNQAGVAVYMPPPPSQIKALIDSLLEFINSEIEQFIPIRACLSHYIFEKIHPFLDGNGRIGRLLIQRVLQTGDYDMRGLLSIEEYLDNNRESYYDVLDNKESDVNEYLEFMLSAIAKTASDAKNQLYMKKESVPEDSLLPRRAEILNIIRDHRMVNFDQIRRRFLRINERTLRYDLKKLTDAGYLKKLGSTKGVYYQVKNSM